MDYGCMVSKVELSQLNDLRVAFTFWDIMNLDDQLEADSIELVFDTEDQLDKALAALGRGR